MRSYQRKNRCRTRQQARVSFLHLCPGRSANMSAVPPSLDFPPSRMYLHLLSAAHAHTNKTPVNAHLLKMSAMGSNDPALRIMEIRPGWSTYMLQKMSLELKLQEAKLTEAIGSNSSDIAALEKNYFSLLKEYCEHPRWPFEQHTLTG